MKVFISWSGTRSRALANALRDWLPMVLQYVEPWVSDKDIGAGDRWAQSIAGELETANFGIICITPENLQSEWVLFEAGALSKSMLDAKVIPLLFGLEMSDLSGPLSQFQAQKVEQAGIMEVIRAINKIAEGKTSDQIVENLVPKLWPSLHDELAKIPDSQSTEKHMRPQHEILEELVTGVRGLNSRIRDFSPELSDRSRIARKRRMRMYPGMFDEIADLTSRPDGSPTILLLMAGFFREEFPWLAEILAESYREIRDGDPNAADQVFIRLRHSIKLLTHRPFFRVMMGESKDTFRTMDEMLMMLEMMQRRLGNRSMTSKQMDQKPPENE